MQIPKEILSEKNYTGTRLIKVNNEKVKELQTTLDTYQKEINPILEKLENEYYKVIDPLQNEINDLMEKIRPLKEKIAELTAIFREDIQKLENTEQKAQLIKNKMVPLINKEIENNLGEFEIARHTKVMNGEIYVEIFDEIEEKVKAIRASKTKK